MHIPHEIQMYKSSTNPRRELPYSTLARAANYIRNHTAIQQYLDSVDEAYRNHLYGTSYNSARTTLPLETLHTVAQDYNLTTQQVEDLYRLHLID